MDSRIIRIIALYITIVIVGFHLVGCIVSAPGKVIYTDANRDPSHGKYKGKIDGIRLLEVNQDGYVLEVRYSGIRYPHGVFIKTETHGPSGVRKGYRSNPYPIRSSKGKARIQVYYRGQKKAHRRTEPARIVAKLYRGEDPDYHFAVSKLKLAKHQPPGKKISSSNRNVEKTISYQQTNKNSNSNSKTSDPSKGDMTKSNKSMAKHNGKINNMHLLKVNEDGYLLEVHYSGIRDPQGVIIRSRGYGPSGPLKEYVSRPYPVRSEKGKIRIQLSYQGNKTLQKRPELTRIVAKLYRSKNSQKHFAKAEMNLEKHRGTREKASSSNKGVVKKNVHRKSNKKSGRTTVKMEKTSVNPVKKEKTGPSTKKTASHVAKGKTDRKTLPAAAHTHSKKNSDSDSKTADPSSDDPAKKEKSGSSTRKADSRVAKGKADSKTLPPSAQAHSKESSDSDSKTDDPSSDDAEKKEKTGSSTKKTASHVAKGKADSKTLPAAAQAHSEESSDSDSQPADLSSDDPAKKEKTGSSTKKTASRVAKGKADSKTVSPAAQADSEESSDSDSQTEELLLNETEKKEKFGASTNKK